MSHTQARGPRMLSMLADAATSDVRPPDRRRKVIEARVAPLLEMDREAPKVRIRAEPSADGRSCRFVVNRPLFAGYSWVFADRASAAHSPLAQALFAIEWVTELQLDDDSATVTSDSPVAWVSRASAIGDILRSHAESNAPSVSQSLREQIPASHELRTAIEEVLEHTVNPAIAAHGGFVELTRLRGNTIFLKMMGGCQGCSGAPVTLRNGICEAIRQAAPGVGAIYDETDHGAGLDPYLRDAGFSHRLRRLRVQIETGDRGMDREPRLTFNSDLVAWQHPSGGAGSGETFAAHAEPAGLAREATLIGPDSGVWSIRRLDVRYQLAGGECYDVRFAPVTLDESTEVNIWQPPSPAVFEVLSPDMLEPPMEELR